MTLRDVMPFGKFKGTPIGQLDKSYVEWMLRQDWLEPKFPTLHKLLKFGEEESSTPVERETINLEGPLLDPMPPAFKQCATLPDDAINPPSRSKSVPSPPPPVGRLAIVGAGLCPAFLLGGEFPSRLLRSNNTAAARVQSPRYPTTKTRLRL